MVIEKKYYDIAQRELEEMQREINAEKAQMSEAVSYTHLDVYKRQSLYFAVSDAILKSETFNTLSIELFHEGIVNVRLAISASGSNCGRLRIEGIETEDSFFNIGLA